MIKLFYDKELKHEINNEIDFGEAFSGESREMKFYAYATTEVRNLTILVKDDSGQIRSTVPPTQMFKDQVWEGKLTWIAGDLPPIRKPAFMISGVEVLGW